MCIRDRNNTDSCIYSLYALFRQKSENSEWSGRREKVLAELFYSMGNKFRIYKHCLLYTSYQWVQKYKTIGYNGLVENRKGRPPQISDMKKSTNPNPLTESEREELIRLRAENEYIKAENEVIKKRIALRQEKWAAQLKAKKQQLSKNLEKRDTN